MMYFVVVVIYFWNVNLYLIICRRLFSRPAWLASQVLLVFFLGLFAWAEKKKMLLVSTVLIGRAAIFLFPFSFFRYSFVLPRFFFFCRGNLGRRMVEESTLIQDSDRLVKKHCLLSFFFIISIILIYLFVKVVTRSFSILLPPGSPSTTRADPLWPRWPPESSRIHKDPDS